jgi:hypothetical protein
MVAAVSVAAVALASTSSGKTAKPTALPPKVAEHARGVLRCPGARKALGYYRAAYARHRAVQRAGGPVPFVRYGCVATIRRAAEWRDRATLERFVAAAWKEYHFAWRKWLPATWYVVGRCETGYGGSPNFAHQNGSFVSAFGISRREYDRDAAYMGAPGWPTYAAQQAGVPLPTPREQLLAAIGHYRRFGDGWSCAGPAGPGAASYGIEGSPVA